MAEEKEKAEVPVPRVLAELFSTSGTIRIELLPPEAKNPEEQESQDLKSRIASLESSLADAQKTINWLGGDLLTVDMTKFPDDRGVCYVTRTFPFAVRLPKGVGAYGIKEENTKPGIQDFERLEGDVVPGHTPVFLSAKQGVYKLEPAPYAPPIVTHLYGWTYPVTPEMRDPNYKYYVLVPDEKGKPVFRLIKTSAINPFRACLRVRKTEEEKENEAKEKAAKEKAAEEGKNKES